jgi:predicted phosphodiesterase
MRIQIASDLHLEKRRGDEGLESALNRTTADVLVLAGDIDRIARVGDTFADWPVPVIYVSGNHDLYYRQYWSAIREARRAFAETSIHFLERASIFLFGARFLGTILWSDFCLSGNRTNAMEWADSRCPDYRCIGWDSIHNFTPDDALDEHLASTSWLETELSKPHQGKTVVVTHHAPHRLSIKRTSVSLSDCQFASELGYLARRADLWIHGHTHCSSDYRLGRCRVICTAAGNHMRSRTRRRKAGERLWQNSEYNPALVVVI